VYSSSVVSMDDEKKMLFFSFQTSDEYIVVFIYIFSLHCCIFIILKNRLPGECSSVSSFLLVLFQNFASTISNHIEINSWTMYYSFLSSCFLSIISLTTPSNQQWSSALKHFFNRSDGKSGTHHSFTYFTSAGYDSTLVFVNNSFAIYEWRA
jgi:hypothetical protein